MEDEKGLPLARSNPSEGSQGVGNESLDAGRLAVSGVIEQSAPNSSLATSVKYARNDYRILPLHTPTAASCSCGKPECGKIGKHPRIGDWSSQASCDVETVAGWFTRWADANIGLLLDDLVCLDVDPKSGGFESLAALEAEFGTLPRQSRQRSGSGGFHYLFDTCEGAKIARGFRNGLDLLTGKGCYIVVAPSLHASGGRYEWINGPHPLDTPRYRISLAKPPEWLLDVANGKKGTAPRAPIAQLIADALAKINEGAGRNDAGLWLFCQMRDEGYTKLEGGEVVTGWVTAANAAAPGEPYTTKEATDSLRQAYRRAPRAPRMQGASGLGLVQDIEKSLKADHHFARDEGDVLYHFEDGVYKATGEKFVRRAVKQYFEASGKSKSWSPELAERVVKWICVDAPELLERPPLDTLNCLNGLLDVKSRQLRPHSPDFLSPVQIGARYDSAAKCSAIDKFVEEVFPADAQHIAFEVAAWIMLPDTSIQKAVLAPGRRSERQVCISQSRGIIRR